MIVGQRHLLQVLSAYVSHYNAHRPHRALGLRAPDSADTPLPNLRPELALANLKRRDLLGGLLHEYRLRRSFGTQQAACRQETQESKNGEVKKRQQHRRSR